MENSSKYTDTITYYQAPGLFDDGKLEFNVDGAPPAKAAPGSPVYARAREVFNQAGYMYPAPPVYLGQMDIEFPAETQYVLRLLIKEPGSAFVVPKKLGGLADFIKASARYQKAHFPDFEDRFAYLTVRSGEVKSKNDDVLHVDGFQGISVPRHIPEQNYIWASSHPAIYSMQPYFVEDIDPGQHNIHKYFEKNTPPQALYSGMEKGVYIIDPYHVHMRPPVPEGTRRSMVRLDFSPVEIRDDTCMVNIWLPRGPYNRDDIRNRLTEYEGPSSAAACGLRPLGR